MNSSSESLFADDPNKENAHDMRIFSWVTLSIELEKVLHRAKFEKRHCYFVWFFYFLSFILKMFFGAWLFVLPSLYGKFVSVGIYIGVNSFFLFFFLFWFLKKKFVRVDIYIYISKEFRTSLWKKKKEKKNTMRRTCRRWNMVKAWPTRGWAVKEPKGIMMNLFRLTKIR